MLFGDLLPTAEHVLNRDETNLAEVRCMLRRHGLVDWPVEMRGDDLLRFGRVEVLQIGLGELRLPR